MKELYDSLIDLNNYILCYYQYHKYFLPVSIIFTKENNIFKTIKNRKYENT